MGVMAGGTVEATLELWVSSLRGREEPDQAPVPAGAHGGLGGLFLDALLGLSGARGLDAGGSCGRSGPWRQQALLGRATWDSNALRDLVRDYAVETLAEPDAVIVVDETGSEQGKASCGVGRQYTGSAGKINQLQIGCSRLRVGQGHAFVDRALPAKSLDRRPGAQNGGACAGKGRLCDQAPARPRHDRAGHRGRRAVRLGGCRQRLWGSDEIEMMLRRVGNGYVLGVNASHPFNS
jgi:hypothetical protein